MLWIPITLAAALLQSVRNAAQRGLTGTLSPLGATATRFIFGFPFAVLLAIFLFGFGDTNWPHPSPVFWLWVLFSGTTQIIGTSFLMHLFQKRNFASGIVLSKSEILLVAVFGLVVLHDVISLLSGIAICTATFGLIILNRDREKMSWRDTFLALCKPAGLYGLGVGASFALAAVGFRAAILTFEDLRFFEAASATLVGALGIQALLISAYLKVMEPGQLSILFKHWRSSLFPGFAGAAASACWFSAMAIEVAAYVRMLGLVEVLFGYGISVLRFKERMARHEIVGTVILIGSILTLLADRAR